MIDQTRIRTQAPVVRCWYQLRAYILCRWLKLSNPPIGPIIIPPPLSLLRIYIIVNLGDWSQNSSWQILDIQSLVGSFQVTITCLVKKLPSIYSTCTWRAQKKNPRKSSLGQANGMSYIKNGSSNLSFICAHTCNLDFRGKTIHGCRLIWSNYCIQ